jgi:hypothetical protein
MTKPKWGAIGAGLAVIVGLFVWHNNGKERIHAAPETVGAAPFATVKACAESVTRHDPAITNETLAHLVNGGFHVVSLDSLHRILGDNQKVAAITRTVIDTTRHDTTVSIYYGDPPRADYLEHEIGNAFGQRHRRLLTGSDTGHLQTAPYYRACVRYCPGCGAY